MNNTSHEQLQLTPSQHEGHSRAGIASFILGLLAILTIVIILYSIFGQSSWISEGNNLVDILLLFFVAFCLMVLGTGLGIKSIADKSSKKVFGVLGFVMSFMSLLAVLVYCCLLGLVFASSGGFGG